MKIKNMTFIVSMAAALTCNPAVRADDSSLKEPVNSVYDHYLKIQSSLAKDSLKGVSDEAGAIAKAVKGDSAKLLPAEVASEAEALAKAADLSTAREDFKPLSKSLIQYLTDHKFHSGSFVEVYCPMADASWLQDKDEVSNPYLGKSMPNCGETKRKF